MKINQPALEASAEKFQLQSPFVSLCVCLNRSPFASSQDKNAVSDVRGETKELFTHTHTHPLYPLSLS